MAGPEPRFGTTFYGPDTEAPPTNRALELATALLPFALMKDDTGSVGATGYDPSTIMRFECSAGEIQVAHEVLAKHYPNLFQGEGK